MTDYLQLLANIGGTVGLVIAGMEAKSFLDQSRHWSHGRLELAAVRHDFIRSTTKDSKVLNQIEYDWLRLMNAGAAPIRIRHLLLHGMDIIDDLMPNELEMNMLLAPSESLVIPVMTRKDEKLGRWPCTWIVPINVSCTCSTLAILFLKLRMTSFLGRTGRSGNGLCFYGETVY